MAIPVNIHGYRRLAVGHRRPFDIWSRILLLRVIPTFTRWNKTWKILHETCHAHCASFFKFQQSCRPLSHDAVNSEHSAPSRQRITHAWSKLTFRWLRLKILELIPSFLSSWCSDVQEHMPFVQSIRLDFVCSHETGFTPLPSIDDIAPASKMPSILLDVLIDVLKYFTTL